MTTATLPHNPRTAGDASSRQRRPPALVVSIDTEEEFDWSRPPAEQSYTITHTPELERLQDALEAAGARGTYVVDYPLLQHAPTIDVLQRLAARGTCELGAHLHPWVNPPRVEAPLPEHTYLSNLPLALQEEKLAVLTEAFTAALGFAPRSFKAGRYGLDRRLARALAAHGYVADASVVAYTSFASDGGPDFQSFTNEPFLLAEGTGPAPPLVEVPCSVAYSRRPLALAHRCHTWLARSWLRPLRPIGLLWRAHLLRKVFLSPEVHAAADLRRGIDALAASGVGVIHLSLHSPSLAPGHTPYVRTVADRAQLLDRLTAAIRHARQRWGAIPYTLSELVAARQECPP